MKKIPSLFKRNYTGDRLVYNEVVEGSEWVLEGIGDAKRKWDGTCCMIKDQIFYKRYDAKNNKKPPTNFIPAQDPDPITEHYPGWVPIGEENEDRYFREGFINLKESLRKEKVPFSLAPLHDNLAAIFVPIPDGTYELCGPKVQANVEQVSKHILISHKDSFVYENCPRTFECLKEWFKDKDIEGIVFHHPDGRMVKIKKKDFWGKR